MGLEVVDNVFMICYALEKTRHLSGSYVECGVFKGSTLLTANEFCKLRGIDKLFVGCDTFSGFPATKEINPNDLPEMFEILYKSGKITEKHYDLSKKRLSSLVSQEHLLTNYFSNTENLVFSESKLRRINLIQGSFSETLPSLKGDISVLHIDCDLYEPYKICLETQFKNVVRGGIIVLDEYYSLKYPGARIAVNEFLESLDPKVYELKMHQTGEFERWFILKK
jgi:hypothetical protein